MVAKPHLQTVTLWVTKLALLTVGGKTPPTKQQIGLYAMTLAADLPQSAFTEASLQEVASGCEFFPAYSVVKTALEAWHDTARAKALASPISIAFREYLDEQQNTETHKERISERMAAAKSDWSDPNKVRASAHRIGDDHPHGLRLGRMLAALVGRHAPENLGYLPPEWLG